MTEAFPLKWPAGRNRTNTYSRKSASFKTTPGRARESLLQELKRLGATNVVITTNVETYFRGGQNIPYANQSYAQDDPGVAVYYTWKNDQYCLACDKWKTVMDNMQALMKTVDAIRGLERWGTGDMVKAAFSGFKALPEQATQREWFIVLGVSPRASISEIREAYRTKTKIHHPDSGGNQDAFIELQNAYAHATQGK